MRLKHLPYLALFLSALAFGSTQNTTSGKDWLLMSDQDKFKRMVTMIQDIHKKEIPVCRAPNVYMALVDAKLTGTPKLASDDVNDVFASILYEREPGARDALDKIKKSGVKRT